MVSAAAGGMGVGLNWFNAGPIGALFGPSPLSCWASLHGAPSTLDLSR